MTVASADATETPLFRQYHGVKSQHPDKLLLFRMGDFYELFFSDAERIAALLGLTLTQRRNNNSSVPMAGVPAHSVEQYISRLVRLGESVVICDQVGTEERSGLMRREVTQIVTPGTLTDQSLLSGKSACIAMALLPAKRSCGYAWLDLARGELRAGQCAAAQVTDQLARLQPSELVLPEGAGVPAGYTGAVRHLPAWDFDTTGTRQKMCDRFGTSHLHGFGLEQLPAATAALMALLVYAEQTQCRKLDHLWKIGAEDDATYVAMDRNTRRSLELTEPLVPGGPCLFSELDSCASSMGSRLLARRLQHPLRDGVELETRLDVVSAVAGVAAQLHALLGRCCDIERIATRTALGSVRPRELAALRATLELLPSLRELLADTPVPVRQRCAALDAEQHEALAQLNERLAAEPPTLLRDGGVIADGCNSELDELRELASGARRTLEEICSVERESSGLTALRAGHNRVHGYYLELPRSHSNEVPAHFQRRQTLKHAERFVTDQLRELEAKQATATERVLELESTLYAQLVADLQAHIDSWRALVEVIAELDIASTLAMLAERRKWVRPSYNERPQIDIRQGRHPVVESRVDYYVPNDASLSPDNRLQVITGPNMGGKSTYMRQVAHIVLLAQIGAPVPAAKAQIGRIDAIHTRIGASDDLAGGRSTFMVEMTETAKILNTAGPNSLVILDEIGRGTSTYDGLALAWAAGETLLQRNQALVLLATHYLEMTELAELHACANNLHMTVGEHEGEVIMLHRVSQGAASRSFGLQVAKVAGVPKHALAIAAKKMGTLEKQPEGSYSQPELFAVQAPQPNAVLERLRNCDPDSLSPRQAHDLLYELLALDDQA